MYSKKNLILLFSIINILSINNFILPIKIKPNKPFYYYTTLFYGEEKTPQDFILDTTSYMISSPCNLCQTCGYHSNEWYNITSLENQLLTCDNKKCGELSGECENNQCSYKYDYYENAFIKGVFVNEKISFDNNSQELFNIEIGCTLNETNYIIAQDSDGIMGLNNDKNSFINRLYELKIISKNLFSIFINQKKYGYLSLGEICNKFHSSNKIHYMPFSIDEEKYYNLQIESFEINNKKIDCKISGIIDSTASLCSFPNNLFDSIVKEFKEKCTENTCGKLIENRHFGVCAIYKNEEEMLLKIKNWLSIKINFENFQFNWIPENYWVNISTEHTFRACLGFEKTEENVIALGTTFLSGYDVIFDRERNRIGFVEVNSKEEFDFSSENKLINSGNKIKDNNKIQEKKDEKSSNEGQNLSNSYNIEYQFKSENKGKSLVLFFVKFLVIFIIICIIITAIIYSFQKTKIKKKKKKKIRDILSKDKEKNRFIKI